MRGVDPATLLAVAPARFESLDEGYCQTLWDGEFHEQDSASTVTSPASPMPAAALRAATADRPLRSPRYRRFVQPRDYDDELRVAFRSGDSTWALVALYRENGRPAQNGGGRADGGHLRRRGSRPPHADGDGRRASRALHRAGPPDVRRLQRAHLRERRGDALGGGIYGHDGGGAESWLDVLADPTTGDLRSAIPIVPLLARARAVAAGRDEGPPRLRLRDHAGR